MRTVRWMTSALALAALVPASGAAQSSRMFQNSWFWGAKGGVMSFSTTTVSNKVAPLVGAEWLITRKQAALYISASQSFFNTTSSFNDPAGNTYTVNMKDMRQYEFALMAFPVTWAGTIRPYAGIGLALNLIQKASPTTAITDSTQLAYFDNKLQDIMDRASFLTVAGLQIQYQRFSVFGQVTYLPAKADFLLNGRTTYMLEAGIRYNFTSSTDRMP